MRGLTRPEIMKIVHQYIGVHEGYLGSFSYPTHAEFYPTYCDLDINPNDLEGTTKDRFIKILSEAAPHDQSKIIRGVLLRFPLNEPKDKPQTRTKELYDEIFGMTQSLESTIQIENPRFTNAVVEETIGDIEVLIQSGRPTSCTDRIHTALHGYLSSICESANIVYEKDDSMARILKLLRQQHPAFMAIEPRREQLERILNAFASILDALNPVRNNLSLAHPNEEMLKKYEAHLIINVGKTLLRYIDAVMVEWDNSGSN